MLREHPIASIDIPELEPFRTLRQTEEHRRTGIFVAEGEKVVLRLLESPVSIRSLLLTPEWLGLYRTRLAARPETIDAFIAPKALLETIVGFPLHQGFMAVGAIPAEPSLASVHASSTSPRLFVAVDGLANAENLGVLVRNCVAFGAQAILVGETSSSPYLRRAVRNSMGTVFKIPVLHTEDLAAALDLLKTRFTMGVIGAHPHEERTTIARTNFRGDVCIVFGSEGDGISERVQRACSSLAAIPMSAGVDSLNVANASAVFLYEVQRQRKFL